MEGCFIFFFMTFNNVEVVITFVYIQFQLVITIGNPYNLQKVSLKNNMLNVIFISTIEAWYKLEVKICR